MKLNHFSVKMQRVERTISFNNNIGSIIFLETQESTDFNESSRAIMSEHKSSNRLQLTTEEMRRLGYRVVNILVEHFRTLSSKPVTGKASHAFLEEALREPIPEQGRDVEMVLQKIEHDIFKHIMHLDHPRFFAFIPSPSNFVSVMADMLASGFNVFAGTWLEGSAATQLELVTIDWLCELCGMPSGTEGLFVSGGSMANLTAMIVARHKKLTDGTDRAVVYCSDQTHTSIERSLRVLGFRSDQLRILPSDEHYRLPVAELRQAVSADRAEGKIPFCIVASAGTTNTGAVDALSEIAQLCRSEDLWFHVDGAYGAAAILSDREAHRLKGLGLADSLSLDPHKWLFQPFEMGCLLVRDGTLLRKSFGVVPEYLKDADGGTEEINFYERGIQMTRSFRALKLWMSLQVFGLDSFRKSVTRGIELAETAEKILRENSCWQIVTPAQLGIVTFRYRAEGLSPSEADALNQRLIEEMITNGFAMLNSTLLKGRIALHMCTINPRTSEEDLRQTIARLEVFGNQLLANVLPGAQ